MTVNLFYHQLLPVTGDWFAICKDRHIDDARVNMERVTAWVLVKGFNEDGKPVYGFEGVHGATASGYIPDDDTYDVIHVNGADRAPDGRIWIDVFNDAPFARFDYKDITKTIGEWVQNGLIHKDFDKFHW